MHKLLSLFEQFVKQLISQVRDFVDVLDQRAFVRYCIKLVSDCIIIVYELVKLLHVLDRLNYVVDHRHFLKYEIEPHLFNSLSRNVLILVDHVHDVIESIHEILVLLAELSNELFLGHVLFRGQKNICTFLPTP